MAIQTPEEVASRIKELNAGWFNVVSEALKLDPSTFLLSQGTLGLQSSDSSGLLLMADAVPPSASVTYFDSGSMVLRSQAYGALLQALQPEESTSLKTFLDDKYAKWIEYRTVWGKILPHTGTQETAFKEWAESELDAGEMARALSNYKAALTIPLNLALAAYSDPTATESFVTSNGTKYALYVYSPSIEAAENALVGSNPVLIDFDSSTMDTSLAHTTVEGSASGFYDIFSGGAGASFEKLDAMAASSDFTIKGYINSSGTLAVHAGNWLNTWELGRAFGAPNDYKVWSQAPHASNWNSFFDPKNGTLIRRVSQLVLVSDYSLTVTTKASFSKEEFQKITAQASFGMWPFFSASASASHVTDYQHEANGSVSYTRSRPKGLIDIWGVTVAEMPN